MDTKSLRVGSRIDHPVYGTGTVVFVGEEYLGIAFAEGGEALLRRDGLEQPSAPVVAADASGQAARPRPESTFVFEHDEGRHFPGSHWEPFVEEASAMLRRLPEFLGKAQLSPDFEKSAHAHRRLPPGWAQGMPLVWPNAQQGLAMIVKIEEDANNLVAVFPVFAEGGAQRLRLKAVQVWESGLEAQITAAWGEAEVTFFDTGFVEHRLTYEAGREYDFALVGIAYDAQPAERREMQVTHHPDVVAWMNRHRHADEEPFAAVATLHLDGMAMFLPIEAWDVDDYEFRGPVKAVEPFTDWLGQDGWRVRATVMRFGEVDADLDIVITRRAWRGSEPPQPGQDIEGCLWLQGRRLR
jgi:hypothetical protein